MWWDNPKPSHTKLRPNGDNNACWTNKCWPSRKIPLTNHTFLLFREGRLMKMIWYLAKSAQLPSTLPFQPISTPITFTTPTWIHVLVNLTWRSHTKDRTFGFHEWNALALLYIKVFRKSANHMYNTIKPARSSASETKFSPPSYISSAGRYTNVLQTKCVGLCEIKSGIYTVLPRTGVGRHKRNKL